MLDRFKSRSYELEHLDKGDYTAAEYESCIVELQLVNKWLGDARALRKFVLSEIRRSGLKKFSLLDVGAGSGELLRVAEKWSIATGTRATLVGLELNARSVQAIAERHSKTISAIRGDAFKLPFNDSTFDFCVCSLFTHHFRNEQVEAILKELSRVAKRRIFVIDLHRHPVAYLFYTTIGHLFLHNRLIREDGALSILRSFTPGELYDLAKSAELKNIKVRRSFPYRLVLSAEKAESAAVAPLVNNQSIPDQIRMAS